MYAIEFVTKAMLYLTGLIMVLAIAILFLFPSREVTQPPGKLQRVWEVLFPGTSPVWGVLGGVALVAWCYFIIQGALLIKIGTPRFITALAVPNLSRSCGIPAFGHRELYRLINPSWVWLYLAPAVLFVVNLFLVLRARRRAG